MYFSYSVYCLVDHAAGPVVMGCNTTVRFQFGHIQAHVVISRHLHETYSNGWIDTGCLYEFPKIVDLRLGVHRTFY